MWVGKKYKRALALVGAAMLAITGCSNSDQNTKNQTESLRDTASETQRVLEKVTYTSADGSVSIILPDSNWKNTQDDGEKLSFTSADAGEITVYYADSKKKVNQLAFGATEEKLVKRLEKQGMKKESLEISDFAFDKSSGLRHCSYILKHKDSAGGIYYTVTEVSASVQRGYQVSADLKKDDAMLLKTVQEAVKSFLVLKNPLTAESGTSKQDEKNNNVGGSSEEQRYFFDEAGNTVYTTPNAEGAWADQDGMTYKFYEQHVEDRNGTVYYYDPPAYRQGVDVSAGSGNGSTSDETADYYDFYDKNGSYIRARQDANGNWVGDDGKTYRFGDEGVTDSDGNFHPY